MRSSQKRKRSPGAPRRPPITPRTYGSRPAPTPYACTRAFYDLEREPSSGRQFQTPFPTESQPEIDDSQNHTDDDLNHVIAAIDMKDYGTVGCAYYSAVEEKVYILGDCHSGETGTVEACRPLYSYLLELIFRVCSTTTKISPKRQVDVRPSQEFSVTNAKNRLVTLDISSAHEDRLRFLVPQSGISGPEGLDTEDMGFTLREGRLLHISSSIDTDNPVSVGCAGAVLANLQRRRATGKSMDPIGPTDQCPFLVKHLEMLMGSNTFQSLQIIQSESHPNFFNQGPGTKSPSSKEGLSIFGLFQRFANTPQGRAKLKQIFFRPSVDLDIIRQRHDFIGVFSRPDNMGLLEKMTKALKHIKNLRPVMTNLHKGISTGSAKITGFKTTVWASLLAFAFYSIDIHDSLREASGANLPLRAKALQIFEAAQLYRVGRMIQEIVDIDNSEEQGRTVVKQGLDRELDMMKDRYDGLNSLLKHVAIDIAMTIPEDMEIDVNVIYFPQLGFNIAIPLNDREQPTYSGTDDWELVFTTENRAYFKDFRMRELDEKLGDIYGLICEKEIEIVYDLAQRVLQYEDMLIEASDVCGDLDSLLAFTQSASFYKLTRPRMVPENIIKIKSGRHLLQEMTVSSYVPNDTLLFGGREEVDHDQAPSQAGLAPSMILLTGPNYSGKSVYMKQVALILYLAQIGSFVPADSAELGITDKILTKINTQESVSKLQSTFMSDLQQISLCLKQVSGRSLVLIDEFGKGTDGNDGIGLACGILDHLLNLEDAPKVIAATHFHEIFEHNFLAPRPRLQLGHMEVKVCDEYREAEDQVTYLYNFRPGRSSKSFGTICAAINGIDAAIVARADEIASLAARGENLIAACAILPREETTVLRQAV
ncbi:DNA mismatch repair protein MutS core [Penicillium argentinense]|uniref:DNA mismatch repair protein MSH5 n=1 Tax=Penicillium argentinense TaxID=1131581 RepID=A0A9W9EIG1_9EURO|nr:DNA mismatch repair protein MutS core [Penicillium argentinense]KAJ5082300.1 DNA mismatch repair protein MutS core [Penicillium argentinense]